MEKGKEENTPTGSNEVEGRPGDGRRPPSAKLSAQARGIEADIEKLRKSLSVGDKRKERIGRLLTDLGTGDIVTDFRFDQVFPRAMRDLSETHWTPIEVAIRAARLLATGPKARILDVGSGCGKFCLIGALTTPAIFVGIEQRAVLVQIAKETRDLLSTRRVIFAHGNMAQLDWSCFDAFYLYNPFYEHQIDKIRIDETLSYSEEAFDDYVRIVRTKLAGLKIGTRVVTYHGFGGKFPPGYRNLITEPAATGFLELWEKTVETPPDWHMIGGRKP